ncbi:pyridoxamine 5'-phosphate oxidase family protein [Leucobacter sp. HNU]|uniref:pyridoxamine 5'-phosphate oxidase family protein n=1 Tax=Leucobacter sp. HNU TaxID=3236805 RepID=UPI003A805321
MSAERDAEPLGAAAIVAFVRAHRDGTVSTLGPDGAPQAAYLPFAATDAGDLVFDARVDSRKIANLVRDPRVAIVVGGADGASLQAEGTAVVTSGADRAAAAAAYALSFPEFADSLARDDIAVVRIRLDWARLGDYRTDPPRIAETRGMRAEPRTG